MQPKLCHYFVDLSCSIRAITTRNSQRCLFIHRVFIATARIVLSPFAVVIYFSFAVIE